MIRNQKRDQLALFGLILTIAAVSYLLPRILMGLL